MVLEISDGNIFVSGMSDDVTRIIPLMAMASYRVLLGFGDDVTTLAAILAMNDTGVTGAGGNRNVWTSAYERVVKDHSDYAITVCDIDGNPVPDGYAETRSRLGITDAPALPDGLDTADVAGLLAPLAGILTSMRDDFISQVISMVSDGSNDTAVDK
jgi:hypothetical protein